MWHNAETRPVVGSVKLQVTFHQGAKAMLQPSSVLPLPPPPSQASFSSCLLSIVVQACKRCYGSSPLFWCCIYRRLIATEMEGPDSERKELGSEVEVSLTFQEIQDSGLKLHSR
jgi:hypothetical protein